MLNVAYRNCREIGAWRAAIENNSRRHLQLIVPNLHWRYSGVTATNRMVAPKLAKMFRAAGSGPMRPTASRGWGRGSDQIVAPPHAADLACAAQQRDDRGRAAALARLAVQTRLHLGGAAPSQLDHALADPADGRDHRHQRPLGVVSQARRPPSFRMASIPSLRAAGGSRGSVRGGRLPGRYAIGCFGRVRAQKGTDVFVDAMCRLLPNYPDFTAVIVGAVTPDQQRLCGRA